MFSGHGGAFSGDGIIFNWARATKAHTSSAMLWGRLSGAALSRTPQSSAKVCKRRRRARGTKASEPCGQPESSGPAISIAIASPELYSQPLSRMAQIAKQNESSKSRELKDLMRYGGSGVFGVNAYMYVHSSSRSRITFLSQAEEPG
ncbi:hypothetical protein PG991_009472 [Apiospora marii]|uniref:Uncharacterized protein n=1 Tax=Apiospora marii TaxID=335849 RepID=A0ABR1RIW2_9PEZI